jgi:hypothetical protein
VERRREWKMIEQRHGAITSDNKIANRGKTRQTFSDLRRRLHCQRFDNGYILQHIRWQAVPFF